MFGNWFKTAVLMAAIVALFGAVGAALGGRGGIAGRGGAANVGPQRCGGIPYDPAHSARIQRCPPRPLCRVSKPGGP